MGKAKSPFIRLTEGEMTIELDNEGKEMQMPLKVAQAFIVPRGTWHRALIARPSRFIGITYGEVTQHRPVTA
jgi:mannose-6-phosphate isomerase-like protein (cupin superfamily)